MTAEEAADDKPPLSKGNRALRIKPHFSRRYLREEPKFTRKTARICNFPDGRAENAELKMHKERAYWQVALPLFGTAGLRGCADRTNGARWSFNVGGLVARVGSSNTGRVAEASALQARNRALSMIERVTKRVLPTVG
jgi:hypothetical protein